MRLVKVDGDTFLVCACGMFRWSDLAGIGWNGGSGMVEVYFKNATAGSWPTMVSRVQLDEFIASI